MSLRWIWIRFLGVPIVFPNFNARRVILVAHDAHHLLTGYDTTWRGEAEIGGFELASGCKKYWAAWMFNLGGFLFGLVIAPARTWRAFVRGRHCTNLYGVPTAKLLQRTIVGARQELGLDRPVPPARFLDGVAFAAVVLLVLVAYGVIPVAGMFVLARWLLGA